MTELDHTFDNRAPVASPSPIPTDDPQAALEFCRKLATLLEADTLPATARRREPPAEIERPRLSVVIPIYNEEANLPALYQRLSTVLAEVGMTYELIIVDDGSRDAGPEFVRERALLDPRITLIAFARNFGHQTAISAGLDYSRGDGVIIMDADLQDPPEVLPQFIAKWQEGHDVVYAIRQQRKESWPKRAAYAAFYRVLQRVANVEIPLDSGDFCIMDRKVVDLLVAMPERSRFVRGIRSWVGLDQVGLAYERQGRYAGESKYSFTRLVYLALDGLVSFSFLPLRIITMLGLGISLLAIVAAVFYAIKKLTVGLSPPGFATLIVAILFLAGIQLCTIGVIGEYVGRIFEEVKRRPLYIVREVITNAPPMRRIHDRRL